MEIRGNLDIHELIQIRGGNPNNEYILTSSDAEGNSLWRQHWFLTQTYWDEWENSYNESESTQNKLIISLGDDITNLQKVVDNLETYTSWITYISMDLHIYQFKDWCL